MDSDNGNKRKNNEATGGAKKKTKVQDDTEDEVPRDKTGIFMRSVMKLMLPKAWLDTLK